MSLTLLNKSFECYQTLLASDLNKITGKIDEIINELNRNLSSVDPENPSSETLQGTIILKLAFKGLTPDSNGNAPSGALTSGQRQNNPNPLNDGWSDNYNNVTVGPGLALFMIIALVRKITGQPDEYLKYEGNNVWQGPFRVGATNTTSGTGADDDKYNYIYCRTATIESNGNFPVVVSGKTNSDWNTLIGSVESNGTYTETSTGITWTDHPYGVTESLPYEWLVGFTLNNNNTPNDSTDDTWSYLFGPICISHWGHNGLDGDGFEYIFYLVGENSNPDITDPSNYWGNLYSGTYKDNSGNIQSATNVGINSSAYLSDDFIPTNWHDEPQAVDNVKTKLYVSTRKRQGGQEITDPWTAFTDPKLWNVYASDGYKLTLDNDTVFVDDNITDSALQIVSATNLHLWNGDLEITPEYTVEINHSNNLYEGIIRPCYVNSTGTSVTNLDWNTQYTFGGTGANSISSSNFGSFCLRFVGSNNLEQLEGTDLIIFNVTKNTKSATRILTFEVKDFNNGEAYMVLVTPNTLYVKKNSSSVYELYNGDSVTISAISAVTNNPTSKKIKTSNLAYGDLYVKILNDLNLEFLSSNVPVLEVSGTNNVSATFTNIGTPVTVTKYILVELWFYINGANDIRVDVETVDFSVKGDDGTVENLELQISGLIDTMNLESYVITGINDNAVIDDQTITVDALRNGTENELTVKKGGSTSGGNLFKITNITLGSNSSLLDVYYYDSGYVLYTSNSGTDGWVSSNKFAILPKWDSINNRITTIEENTKLTTGNFYYDVLVKNNEGDVGTKRFNLNIFDISVNGSYYKLNILNDVLSYDSEEDILSTEATSKIEIYTVDLQGLSTSFIKSNSLIYPVQNDPNNYVNDTLYIDFGDLKNYVNKENGHYKVTQDSNTGNYVLTLAWNNSIQYRESGYDITLYKCIDGLLKQLDKEHIDCIKDGAPGNNGYNSVIVRLYKRSNSIISSHGILNTTYYDFENKTLYKINSGGNLSNEVVGIKTNPSSDLNGWSNSVDNATISNGSESDNSSLLLYMTAATAMGNSSIDDISNTEWSDPIPVSDDGSTPDYNIRTIYLYQHSETCPNKPNYNEISSPYRIWYRFSNNKFYTDKDVLDSDTSGTQGMVNVDSNWRLSISTSTNLNLWETHATAVSLTDEDEIKSIEWSTPSIVSSKVTVESGLTGKMFYMMGNWDPAYSYVLDNNSDYIPLVYFHESGLEKGYWWRLLLNNRVEIEGSNPTEYKYYAPGEYPTPDIGSQWSGNTLNGTAKVTEYNGGKYDWSGTRDGSDPYTYVNEYWEKCEQYGVVITEGIFSEFAKLGSAIISGDYMFSMNGYIGTTPYIDGNLYNNSKPAYVYFYPLLTTTVFSGEKTITFPDLTQEYAGSDGRYVKDTGIKIYIGSKNLSMTYNIQYTAENSEVLGNVNFAVGFDSSTGNIILNSNGVANNINSSQFDRYRDKWVNIYAYGNSSYLSEESITITSVTFSGNYFKPNWCVDLKTGKMIAGLGNFVVNPDGSVVAANGNFIINPDGSVEAAGGKFIINANGTLTISNTLILNTDYRYTVKDLILSSGTVTSNIDLFERWLAPNELSDIISIRPDVGTSYGEYDNGGDSYKIVLPNPNLCIGRCIEICVGGNMPNSNNTYIGLYSTLDESNVITDADTANPFYLTGVAGNYGQAFPKVIYLKHGNTTVNTYPYIKAIAMELTSGGIPYDFGSPTGTKYATWCIVNK